MGRRSTRVDKNIFQLSREQAGLTRQDAGDQMGFVTEDRIEKIEDGKSAVRADEVLAMAECYHDATLCNRYCSQECPIGQLYIPAVRDKELSQITLEILASLNSLYKKRDRFVEIAAAEDIAEEDMTDFIAIGKELERFSMSVDSMKLWMRKKIRS